MSDALSQAAQLKPDVRLGLAISEFRAAPTADLRLRFNWYRYKIPIISQSLDRRIKSLSLPDSQGTFFPVVS